MEGTMMQFESCYVAGPMTNRPRFNFDTFDEVAWALRQHGKTVHNPHEHDVAMYPGIDDAAATITGDVAMLADEVGFDLGAALSWDYARIIESDAIVLLPEWETSSGARSERFVAEMTGRQVWLAIDERDAWRFALDPVQRRMAGAQIDAA
jgi:hypothetical protein